MARESKYAAHPDKPLRRVVLIPTYRIPIVHRELVMEVMISFADGNKGGNHVVTRSVLVIERRLSEPMRERVYAESRVVDECQTKSTRVDITAKPVAPQKPGDESGHDEAHEDEQGNVPLVLPANDAISAQIGDVCNTRLAARFDKHPPDV